MAELDVAIKWVGLLTGVIGLWKWIIHPLMTVVREVGPLKEAITVIRKEVQPNGGSSIKDGISRIERAIGRLEEIQAARLNSDDMAIFEADAAGRYIWVNKSLAKLCGRESVELYDHGWKNCVHQDDREKVAEEWRSAIEDWREFEMDFRLVNHFNGNVTPVHTTAVRVSTGFLGFVRKRDVA